MIWVDTIEKVTKALDGRKNPVTGISSSASDLQVDDQSRPTWSPRTSGLIWPPSAETRKQSYTGTKSQLRCPRMKSQRPSAPPVIGT